MSRRDRELGALTAAVDRLERSVSTLSEELARTRADLAAVHSSMGDQDLLLPNVLSGPASGLDEAPTSSLPTFSSIARDYIAMRLAAAGGRSAERASMTLRLRTFHEVTGDRPIDRYTRRDLQDYVNRMQFWPANGMKRAEWSTLTTSQILELNGSLQERPIGRKTMEHGYVATIRAAMGRGCDEYGIPNPFLRARIRWPDGLAPSIAREPISHDVLNRTFELGVASGYLDRAMLPLLAYLTGRRIGLLCHLQGQDIRQKDGVWIARTAGIVKASGGWKRVPYKTEPSTQFFVLHRFLAEIGFTEWASRQDGFVFAELQKLADPSRTASQALNRLLRKAGAAGDRREVFHSLRGDRIDENRD